jgi:type I restriction enzyme M protein
MLRRFPSTPVIVPLESLEDSANLPDPDVVALEIAEELEAALEQFAQIAEDLKR